MTKLVVTFRSFTNALEKEWWRLEVLVIQLASGVSGYSFAPEHYAQSAASKQTFLTLSSHLEFYLICFPGEWRHSIEFETWANTGMFAQI